jgi:hypothetical protein
MPGKSRKIFSKESEISEYEINFGFQVKKKHGTSLKNKRVRS